MRIAFLLPCYWPEVRRGAERYARDLADGLIARGHQPRLITSHPGWPSRRMEDGLEVIRNWRPPDRQLRRRMYEDYLTHVPFSWWSLTRGDDDIAQAFFPTDGLAAVRWAERTGRPSILNHHGIPDHVGLTMRRRLADMTARVAGAASAVTVSSRVAADAFGRWLGVEARVIPPPVDLSVFRPSSARAEQPTIFCPAAPDVERKRVPLLVEAFRRVRREHADARLVLLESASKSGARDGVELVEPTEDRGALARRYSSAWVTALPSVGEALGLVLAESLACGTPVVGTNAGGIPEVIDRHAVGRLFDGDDPEALSRALLETLELATVAGTSEACRARAQDYSAERFIDSYDTLYRELLG